VGVASTPDNIGSPLGDRLLYAALGSHVPDHAKSTLPGRSLQPSCLVLYHRNYFDYNIESKAY
jgi:hypothetical protein